MRSTWHPRFSQRYNEPWFLNLDHETQQRFMAQDQERLDIHNRTIVGKATALEFVECCTRQANENLAEWDKRNRRAMGKPDFNPDSETLRKAREELGLEATEHFSDSERG